MFPFLAIRSLSWSRSLLFAASVSALGAAVGCSSDAGPSDQTGGSTPTAGGRTANGGASAGAAKGGGAPVGGAMPSAGSGGVATSGGNGAGGAPSAAGTGGLGGTAGGVGGRTGAGGTMSGGAAGRAGAGGTGGVTAGGAGGGGSGGNGQAGAGTGGAGGAGGSYCPTTPGTACNIMPVGDSITEGCCTAPMGGYRIELFRQASTNNKNITFVGTLTNGPTTVDNKPFPQSHEGHGGWKISQIAGVIDNAISSSKPHIVLLKIGTNDINGNDNISNAPNRLASLIDQICKDAPNALLVVSAIIPTTDDGTNGNVRAYNTAIKAKAEAAAATGKHVLFVDNYDAFAQNSSYKTALMADGLHPNTAGYAVLGKSFYGMISSYLQAK